MEKFSNERNLRKYFMEQKSKELEVPQYKIDKIIGEYFDLLQETIDKERKFLIRGFLKFSPAKANGRSGELNGIKFTTKDREVLRVKLSKSIWFKDIEVQE
jgi:nucleoid DNA-binding protein